MRPSKFLLKTFDPARDDGGVFGRIGDKANSDGARLVRDLQHAIMLIRIRHTPARKAVIDGLLRQIGIAVQRDDSKILREMADFIDAAKDAKKNGHVTPGFSLAADFVRACQSKELPLDEDMVAKFRSVPTLKAAMQKGPHTPTVAQIWEHLGHCMHDKAPDYKTVERWARKLGIKARPRKTVK